VPRRLGARVPRLATPNNPRGQVMIKLEGRGLEDDKVLEDYLNAMDFKRIQGALAL